MRRMLQSSLRAMLVARNVLILQAENKMIAAVIQAPIFALYVPHAASYFLTAARKGSRFRAPTPRQSSWPSGLGRLRLPKISFFWRDPVRPKALAHLC